MRYLLANEMVYPMLFFGTFLNFIHFIFAEIILQLTDKKLLENDINFVLGFDLLSVKKKDYIKIISNI